MSSSPTASPAGLGAAPIGRTASPRPPSTQPPSQPAASPAASRTGLPSRPPPPPPQQQQQQQQQQQPDLARRSYGASPSPNPTATSAQANWRASSGLNPSAAMNQRLASRGHNSLLASPLSSAFGGLGNTAHSSLSPGFGPSQPQRPGTIGGAPAGHGSLHGTPADQSGTMDRWFEDLQNYEHTLEEMAAASLDANFKEELGAIEQWFRVLSEAERTAALYSLLQESTQVQIRFFITVLQQMARTDPVHALLSPVTGSHNGINSTTAEQLEAKMANLGLAPPTAQAAQQANKPYRSPALEGNAALSQAARLKANRTSAPEHLAHFTGSNASAANSAAPFSSSRLDNVSEGVPSAARPRPSTLGGTTGSQPRSPVPGSGPTSPPPEDPAPGSHPASRPASRPASGETPLPPAHEFPSDASNEWEGANAAVLQQAQLQAQLQAQGALYDPAQAADLLRSPNAAALFGSPLAGLGSPNAALGGLSPAALAGLQSPSGGLGNPANLQAMNALAGLGAGLSPPQLIALQQSLLAQIAVTNGQFAGAPPQGLSPHLGGGVRLPSGQYPAGSRQASRNFHGAGLNVSAANAPGTRGGVKSPRLGAPRSPGPVRRAHSPAPRPHTPHNEEEVADITVLEDTGAWLRQLRLHKYTPNFATSHWRDMVVMDDAALQGMGVAALGARRKMLKTFDAVRKRYGIADPPSVAAEKAAAAKEAGVPPVPRVPTPQPE